MANLLRTGAQWMSGKLKAEASELVTYTRASDSVSGGLYVTPGETRFEKLDSDGLSIEARVRDFTFEAADLVLSSVTVLPAKGDQIVMGTTTYEVLPIGGGELWRPCDRSEPAIRIRVHTKEIAVT